MYILLKIKDNEFWILSEIEFGLPVFSKISEKFFYSVNCMMFSDDRSINLLKTNNPHFWQDLEFFETILTSDLKKKIFEFFP